MPRAWRNLIVLIGLLSLTLTGCTENNVNVSNSDIDTATELLESSVYSIDKDYTPISFVNIPESIDAEYTYDNYDVSIVGYLSSSISNDKSTGYLFNSGYGTIPSETTVGKCVVLDLSDIKLSDTFNGDNFVTVYGSIVTDEWNDIYNTKSKWHLQADKVEPLISLPDNVQEYQNYMESDEFEAFGKLIDFVGTAVYTWYTDDSVIELDIEDIGCNTKELTKNTKEKYPELYSVIKEYEANLVKYYNDIVKLINAGERPEDINVYYDGLYTNYAGLTEDLISYGMINNGG